MHFDYRLNTYVYDPILESVIAPHGGLQDLNHLELVPVSLIDAADPTLFLRGMHFLLRDNFTVSPETMSRIRESSRWLRPGQRAPQLVRIAPYDLRTPEEVIDWVKTLAKLLKRLDFGDHAHALSTAALQRQVVEAYGRRHVPENSAWQIP